MLSKIFISALVAVASAAPVVQRSCTEGLFNCIDGKTYAQCISGGTWGTTMSVAPGTTCNIGISANPFIPSDGSSGGNSPPPPPPATTTAASPPQQTTDSPPPPPQTTTSPTPTPATTTAQTTAVPTTQPTSPPSGSCTNNAAGGQFADESCWLSWEAMKAKYLPIMGQYCSSWGANNSPEETAEVFSAIEAASAVGNVDKRFILSLVQQESTGCVRVITTNNGVRNPGLLQDSNGSHTCNEGGIQNPCPVAEINGMIDDGVNQGDNNLAKAIKTANAAGFTGSKGFAVAARIYNSGSYDANNLANGLGSTGPYVDQILNRLTGVQT